MIKYKDRKFIWRESADGLGPVVLYNHLCISTDCVEMIRKPGKYKTMKYKKEPPTDRDLTRKGLFHFFIQIFRSNKGSFKSSVSGTATGGFAVTAH